MITLGKAVLVLATLGLLGCAGTPKPTVRVADLEPWLMERRHPYALQYNGQAFVAPVPGFMAWKQEPVLPDAVIITDTKQVKPFGK